MARMERLVDWREFHEDQEPQSKVAGFKTRTLAASLCFTFACFLLAGQVIRLEITQGAAFRQAASEPRVRTIPLPAPRGRILARDGTVLAHDEPIVTLELFYRELEQPPSPNWLNRQVRSRLPRSQWKNEERVQTETTSLLAERRARQLELAKRCGLSQEEWDARCRKVQQSVEALGQHVNEAREKQGEKAREEYERKVAMRKKERQASWWAWGKGWVEDFAEVEEGPQTRPKITVAEEVSYHVLVEGVPLDVVADVEAFPEKFAGFRIGQLTRRRYPQHTLAAHVLGHLTPHRGADGSRLGQMGVELAREKILLGEPGELVERVDRAGQLVGERREREAKAGQDVILTLDAALQRTAEELLDNTLARTQFVQAPALGAAAVVLDVRTGAVLASASAPRFSPADFTTGDDRKRAALLENDHFPLFDRALRMAIPPGSTFKVITAAAILQTEAMNPDEPLWCQGYWKQPDRLRCAIFRQTGQGHGETNLSDALTQSCNVYFFQAAEKLGPRPLADWAARFGLGSKTGIDLPAEPQGQIADEGMKLSGGPGSVKLDQTQAMAIGQGKLLATPMQMARAMAAVANGGKLVTPFVVNRVGLVQGKEEGKAWFQDVSHQPPVEIEGIRRETVSYLQTSLQRVVADSKGTARETVYWETLPIAGKTGTAEVGGGLPEHAWFVGYAPADGPRVAVAVVVEQGGGGGEVAGPIARRLVQRMQELGYFPARRLPP